MRVITGSSAGWHRLTCPQVYRCGAATRGCIGSDAVSTVHAREAGTGRSCGKDHRLEVEFRTVARMGTIRRSSDSLGRMNLRRDLLCQQHTGRPSTANRCHPANSMSSQEYHLSKKCDALKQEGGSLSYRTSRVLHRNHQPHVSFAIERQAKRQTPK